MYCVIVANGEFCTHKIPLKTLKNANFIIACDGAANELLNNKIEPNVIIGDLDSLNNIKTNAKIIKIKNQNTNDLTKAVKYALSLKYEKVYILGAGGKRDDHFIANISLLIQYFGLKNKYKKIVDFVMQTNFGEFFVSNDDYVKNSFKGQKISFFCLDKNAKFSSNNLKYEFKNYRFKELNLGTLNESLDDNFGIINHDKARLLTYINFG